MVVPFDEDETFPWKDKTLCIMEGRVARAYPQRMQVYK